MDKTDVRRGNLELLMQKLGEAGQATKPELSKLTGLSVVTINTLIAQMVKSGEVKALDLAPSGGGRRPKRYKIAADRYMALACYLYEEGGIVNLIIFLENLSGEIVEQQVLYQSEVTKEIFFKALSPYLKKYPQITAVTVGLPGAEIDLKIKCADFPALDDAPLREWLSAKLSRPVNIVGDVRAAVFGVAGSLDPSDSGAVVGVRWSRDRSPAVGIMLDGQIYRGRDRVAGQIAYLFDDTAAPSSLAPLEEAAKAVGQITALINPNTVILYNDRLKVSDAAEIKTRLTPKIPAKFLPNILIRPDMGEDYSQGIYNLALRYLKEIIALAKGKKS